MKLSAESATLFCMALFQAAGLSPDHARLAAANLVEADLDDVRTHGLARLAAYIAALERGAINARPAITVTRHGATAVVDGDNGPGAVVADTAMREAMDLARASGVGLVAVRRSNHFGTAGQFVRMAAGQGMIGLAMSNASATVAPHGGTAPAFGTNPLAFGAPAGTSAPFLLDMASSAISRGEVRLALAQGRTLLPGVAAGPGGEPTTDPAFALDGALYAFGGPKGYGIALMVEVLSSMLSDAASGAEITNMYQITDQPAGIGHLFMVIDIAAFRPLAGFTAQYDRFAAALRATPTAEGAPPVRLPGEARAARRQTAERQGFVLPAVLVAELTALAARCGVPSLSSIGEADDHTDL